MKEIPTVADGEYANLRGAYGYLDVEPLTTQQELFLLTHLRGVSVAAAARAAGMNPSTAYQLMKQPRMEVIKDFFRAQLLEGAQVEMGMLNNMALEAHRKSATATEELKAVEVLAKLNQVGGYAPPTVLKERSEQNEERDITPKSTKELEHMDEAKLLQLADMDGMESLDPTPVERVGPTAEDDDVIEGELVGE